MGGYMRIDRSSGGISPRQGLNQVSQDLGATYSTAASAKRLAQNALDPTGPALSSKLAATIRSLGSASRGITHGIELAQGAAEHLSDASSLIERMRELAVQSGNGSPARENGAPLQVEFDGLRKALDGTSEAEAPGGRSQFDESKESTSIQAGFDDGERIEMERQENSGQSPRLSESEISLVIEASSTLEGLTNAQDVLNELQSELGVSEDRLSNTLKATDNQRLSLLRTKPQAFDADIALETAEQARQQLLQSGSASVHLQSNVAALRAQSLLGGLA